MLRDYEMEVLRIESDGSVTLLPFILENDPDTSFGGAETGTVWRVGGVALPGIPQLQVGSVELEIASGTFTDSSALIFSSGGVDYVIPRGVSPETVTGASNVVVSSPIQTNFIGSTATLLGTDVTQTTGLIVNKDAGGGFTGVSVGTFALLDDDARIQIEGDNETGQPPILVAGFTSNVIDVSANIDVLGLMQLVEVECVLAGGGTATFEALRTDGTSTLHSFLVPLAGSVNPFAITAVNSVTVLANTLDGMKWSDFGFGLNRAVTSLSSGDDTRSGDFTNETIRGLGGNDTLFGLHGEDLLDGGAGGDILYGGQNSDTLIGFSGNDVLFGGSGDDNLQGGANADELLGGTGSDRMAGGGGGDILNDGEGRDTLRGGGGGDTFVLHRDGAHDTVADFADGVDLLDLGVKFRNLTMTDLGAGIVRIDYGGDTAFVSDTAGLLTLADLTRADFV